MADDEDYEPADLCREEPRRKSICKCRCGRPFGHPGKHYCADCGWSWGRGRLTDANMEEAAKLLGH